MRIFKVPFEVKREEKIFGGYLSIRQVICLMLGVSSFAILITKLPIMIKISFISIILIFSILCAFFKIKEQNFDKVFIDAIKYLIRKKNYVYDREVF